MNEISEDLKDKAFKLLTRAADGEDIKEGAMALCAEYKELGVKYPRGSEVWYLDEKSICRCNVVAIGFNYYGHPLYRISEVGGRTVNGGYGLPEDLIFKTREDLVECFKKVLGL